ncbi:hypothetical protein [Streptomyces sp. CB01580]|uniref:hypothetical protein n=1 Tax=Streptomyces sp. CB01580 TaxID=1703933 RepID=UPI001160EF22|nr:hypothetical protein [Streptomyces sp. CB01580]
MTDPNTPTPLAGDALELAKLRAGLTAGLTPEQSARLIGSTEDELTADAQTLAAEFSTTNPAPPAPRVGGPRGVDVTPAEGASAGAARYRRKAGLDEDGRRPQVPQRSGTERTANPFAAPSYTMS